MAKASTGTETLIGRKEEQKLLEEALHSPHAELIAIYGRRRVGKTFLVRSFFKNELVFEFTGVHNASLYDQLQNFTLTLEKASGAPLPLAVPDGWIRAFDLLKNHLAGNLKNKKSVVFFDEFPWIQTPRSGFLQAFEHFWNSWATKQNNIIIVICGSAASWMIENIVNNRGGLHNRLTQRIRLLPFTLHETEAYLRSRRVRPDRYQLLQLYMAIGGIPQYLKDLKPGESAAQNIDRLCFTKDGPLRTEFQNLYRSLFDRADDHEAVVRALSKKKLGLSRNEIIKAAGLSLGGNTSKLLAELEESGFISQYIPFGKTERDRLYKLSDEYSLFYLKFIEDNRATGKGSWQSLSATPSYISWGGFAFEAVCQKHVIEIRRALGIGAVHTEVSAWRHVSAKGGNGAQIDLLLDRADHCINICEMKFSVGDFIIDKKYSTELENKRKAFKEVTETKKTIFITMITTYGVKRNDYFTNMVDAEVKMDKLFEGQ